MKTFKLIACMICISAGTVMAQSSQEKKVMTPMSQPQKVQPAVGTEMKAAEGKPASATMRPGAAGRMTRFMVQLPHTAEQCESIKEQLKGKNNATLMRFDWGCASGEHIGYGMFAGQTADDVRKQLPEGVLKSIKVTKVEKATIASTEPVQNVESEMKK